MVLKRFHGTGPDRIFPAPRISFEFFPPKSDAMEASLWQAIRRLEPLGPDFVSVTYGAGGSTRERTHRTVIRIAKETTIRPAAHLTCVCASRSEADAVIREYEAAGIRHIVALRGDPPGGLGGRYEAHPDGYATSADLVTGIKALGDFEVSVACYPETHPEAASPSQDLDVLQMKIDAGADRAITQFFFDPEVFLRFLERVRARGISIPIVPGILPIANFANARAFAARAGANVPGWLEKLFDGLDEDPETRQLIAATTAAELCLTLRENGVESFHFFTLNRPELTYATCRILGIAPSAHAQESLVETHI